MPAPVYAFVRFNVSYEQWMAVMSIDSVEGKLAYIAEKTIDPNIINDLKNALIKQDEIIKLRDTFDVALGDDIKKSVSNSKQLIYHYNSERLKYLSNVIERINMTIIDMIFFVNSCEKKIMPKIYLHEFIANLNKLYDKINEINDTDYTYYLSQLDIEDSCRLYNSYRNNFFHLITEHIKNDLFIPLLFSVFEATQKIIDQYKKEFNFLGIFESIYNLTYKICDELVNYFYLNVINHSKNIDLKNFMAIMKNDKVIIEMPIFNRVHHRIYGNEVIFCFAFLRTTYVPIKDSIDFLVNIEDIARLRWLIVEKNNISRQLRVFHKREFDGGYEKNEMMIYASVLVDVCKFNFFKMLDNYAQFMRSINISDGHMAEELLKADAVNKQCVLAAKEYIHAIALFGYALNGCLTAPFLSLDAISNENVSYCFVLGFISLALGNLLDYRSILKLVDYADRVSDYFTSLSFQGDVGNHYFLQDSSKQKPPYERTITSSSSDDSISSSPPRSSFYRGSQIVLFAGIPSSKIRAAAPVIEAKPKELSAVSLIEAKPQKPSSGMRLIYA